MPRTGRRGRAAVPPRAGHRREALGPEHPDVARPQQPGGSAQGHQPAGEAEPLYRRALAITRGLGPEHPNVAADLNNLALLLGPPPASEAEPLYRRALAIDEKASARIIPT